MLSDKDIVDLIAALPYTGHWQGWEEECYIMSVLFTKKTGDRIIVAHGHLYDCEDNIVWAMTETTREGSVRADTESIFQEIRDKLGVGNAV